MPLVPDDDMIETLASNGADDPFDITILPGRLRCRWYIVDSHRFYSIPVEPAVGAVSITDNIARHLVPVERFGNLPCRPFSGRTCSNFEMDQLAAIVTENDEYIEDSKGQRRNDQEIDRGRAVEVIEEERLPCLIRIRPCLCSVRSGNLASPRAGVYPGAGRSVILVIHESVQTNMENQYAERPG